MEVIYSKVELAADLANAADGGFDVANVSKVAFEIYQTHGLELTESMDRILLMLIAMEEGEEFELSELDFLSLIEDIKKTA
ncbi:hypothetical protein FHW69_000143 [Luteibacter sp. Sphag1AF]|uniref:hypothetical protein n=1 Tax=Luteibacter sp. Sphag1AF TaxID=2587031 RepID=UPI00161A0A75|nr:hypothetical protein [Luteibacter sp. Sphag1AF]MBB3225553.1 hypothetical protein [Luteibacter sp. Sphag1AF]